MPLARSRAALITYVKCTFTQYNLPEPEQNISRVSQREGVAEEFTDTGAARNVRPGKLVKDAEDEQREAVRG